MKELIDEALYNFVASRKGATTSVKGDLFIKGEHVADAAVQTQLGFVEVIQKTLIGYTGGFEHEHSLALTAQASTRLPLFGTVQRGLKLGEAALDNADQYLKLRSQALARLPKAVQPA